MENEVILEVNSLVKRFEINKGFLSKKSYKNAVNNVSLNIHRGESLGIVGESGCGKSTLARLILNLLEPNSGKIVFSGQTIYNSDEKIKISNADMAPLRRDMQIIFQDPYSSLDPKMTICEIIGEGIKKHRKLNTIEIENEVKKILGQCGLDETYINKYPFELSGGQRQRVGIARALGVKPKFIICDEPTAALDVSVQAQVLNLMLDLKESEKLTYMFISHNLEIVRFFCDRIAVMHNGEIVEIGKSDDIYNKPSHPYTKSLIKAIPNIKYIPK